MLRGCSMCSALKPHSWFDLSPTLCNTCSRQTPEWMNDITVYPPLIQAVRPEIDWTPVHCSNPSCNARLFQEEISFALKLTEIIQFQRKTGRFDAIPCCVNGVANIHIQWPVNAEARIPQFSSAQWSAD